MKMKYFYLVLSLLIGLTSCRYYGVRGSGDVTEEKRDVEEFSSLSVGGIFEVEVTCGKEPSLTIEAEDNLIPLIKTEVEGDRLIISTRKHISPRKGLKITLSTYELNDLDISGACKVKVEGIKSNRFSVDASGASNLYLQGETKKLSLDISGASKLNAVDLISETVLADLSGASNADVYASQDLRADLSGASHMDYYGDPKSIKPDCSGASSMERK